MKEATGELNMTVIAVVAIVGIGALFATLILPRLRSNLANSSKCSDAACSQSECGTNKTCSCDWVNEEGTVERINCKNPYLND